MPGTPRNVEKTLHPLGPSYWHHKQQSHTAHTWGAWAPLSLCGKCPQSNRISGNGPPKTTPPPTPHHPPPPPHPPCHAGPPHHSGRPPSSAGKKPCRGYLFLFSPPSPFPPWGRKSCTCAKRNCPPPKHKINGVGPPTPCSTQKTNQKPVFLALCSLIFPQEALP